MSILGNLVHVYWGGGNLVLINRYMFVGGMLESHTFDTSENKSKKPVDSLSKSKFWASPLAIAHRGHNEIPGVGRGGSRSRSELHQLLSTVSQLPLPQRQVTPAAPQYALHHESAAARRLGHRRHGQEDLDVPDRQRPVRRGPSAERPGEWRRPVRTAARPLQRRGLHRRHRRGGPGRWSPDPSGAAVSHPVLSLLSFSTSCGTGFQRKHSYHARWCFYRHCLVAILRRSCAAW